MLRRNVLILHAGALGDFVLAWPLILALGRIHPQSRIIVVTHASKGALAEAALRVESADIEHGWHVLHGAAPAQPDGAAPSDERGVRLLGAAHSIYSFISAPGDAATANLQSLAGPEAQVIALAPRPPAEFTAHASDFLAGQLAGYPVVHQAVQQMIKSVAARGISSGRSAAGDVVIHPGSGAREKCWPIDRFGNLIEKLRHKHRPVRVLLGEVEIERMPSEQIAALQAAGAEIHRPPTYLALFNALRTATLFIGHDSGPSHLAGVMGVPTLALFGPTDPAVWRPLGPHVSILRRQPLEKLSVTDVFKAATALGGSGA
jgi:ADP-heptose:LPS heptosyltransferase